MKCLQESLAGSKCYWVLGFVVSVVIMTKAIYMAEISLQIWRAGRGHRRSPQTLPFKREKKQKSSKGEAGEGRVCQRSQKSLQAGRSPQS